MEVEVGKHSVIKQTPLQRRSVEWFLSALWQIEFDLTFIGGPIEEHDKKSMAILTTVRFPLK